MLALIAERASGCRSTSSCSNGCASRREWSTPHSCASDELPGRAALGYVEVDGVMRSNVFHLPVRGNGDGGIYSTVADIRSFWTAFFAGVLVPPEWVPEMVRPRSVVSDSERYGLGFWLAGSGDAVRLEGYDAGVSFRSWHHPTSRLTHTVISNTSDGAWPVTAPALRSCCRTLDRLSALRRRQEVEQQRRRPRRVPRAASSGPGLRCARSATAPSMKRCEPSHARPRRARSRQSSTRPWSETGSAGRPGRLDPTCAGGGWPGTS